MANVLTEGWDHSSTPTDFNLKAWVYGNSAPFGSLGFFVMVSGRLSGRAIRMEAGNPLTGQGNSRISASKILPSTYATAVAGFAFNFGSTVTDCRIFSFYTAAGALISSVWLSDSTKHLYITNAAGGTVATGTTALVANTWNYIEFKTFVNGASGTGELHLNGVSGEIASTVGNFGSTNIGQVQIGYDGIPNSSGQRGIWDDMYVVDTSGSARNTFLGDNRVETLYASADGANLFWVPDSGSAHFSRVNENSPDSDASYVADATPGDRDTYVFTDLATLVGTVNGVQVSLFARKDDAAARQIATVVRIGGSNYDGVTAPALTTSYQYYPQLYDQAPSGADWTIAMVNAAEFGVKEVA